jgi:hypothetical protein
MNIRFTTTTAPDSPVHRQTSSTEDSGPFWERSDDLLHWIWSWNVQVSRLKESTSVDGQGTTPTERRRAYSRTSLDEHLLVVVGGHVVTSLRRFGEVHLDLLDPDHLQALQLLRNLYEHWDEQRDTFRKPDVPRVKSGKTFSEKFPEGRPYSITYASNDWILGGVVPISVISLALAEIEQAVIKLENEQRLKDQTT